MIEQTGDETSVSSPVCLGDKARVTMIRRNLEAEQMVLGALLTGRIQANSSLAPIDFGRGLHQRIFAAIARQNLRDTKINCTSISEELTRSSELDSCGGVDYLLALVEGSMNGLFTLDNALRTLRECARLRRLLDS